MKPFIALLVLPGLLFVHASTLHAQPAFAQSFGAASPATNRVLELDGKDSFVELPNAVFEKLDDATVEGWVKWERFAAHSRFFDFGEPTRSIAVKNQFGSSELVFDLIPDASTVNQYQIRIPGLLQLDQWCHIAAIS